MEAKLGIDLLSNVAHIGNGLLGFYAGVGSRFQALIKPDKYGELPIIGRFGLSYSLNMHRFEIGTQIPFITWSIEALNNKDAMIFTPVSVGLSYNVVF